MRYDGSINFDTRIDGNGFNRGIKSLPNAIDSLKSSFSNLAKTIGIAFSVTTILNFGKNCIETATEVENAWVGLNSIINATGKSFENAKSFLKEYVSDGLVPLKNAVTAYKNLSLRGYTEEQIQAVLIAFKNSATYARQSQYTLGEAISTATEGLKNENSILVDNAGVTKNVAQMWKDYANSIGTTYTSLTKQQKIQAEVNGIIEETKFQMGDATKYSNTYSGQIARLSATFTNLKMKIGNILKVIAQSFIPIIHTAISSIEHLADKVTGVLSSWGIKTDVVDTLSSVSDIADSTEALTENLDEADKSAKKLQKNLAGFDKLNVLNKNNDESSNDTATSETTMLPTISSTVNTEPVEASVNILTEIFEKLKKKLQPTIDAVKRLKEALEPLKKFTFKALEDFYTDFLRPIGDWVLGKGLPKFIDIITDLVKSIDWDKLNKSLDDFWKALEPFAENIGNGLLWFLDEVLSPIAEWTINDAVPVFLDTLTAALNGLNSVINSLKQPANWLLENLLKPLGKLLSTEFSEISIKIPDGVQKILNKFSELITALHPFFDWLIKTINPAVLGIARGISIILGGVLDFIIDVVSGIIETLTGIVDFLTGIFTADWDKVWKGIKEIFGGIFDIIKGIVVGIGKTLAGLVIAIGGTVVSVLQGAWDIGANLIKGIFKGITDLFGNIGRWIKEHIVDPWINSFRQLFGIHSPSTVMAEIGTFIIRGLLNGLKDKFVAVLEWLKSLPEKFTNGFSKVVEGIKEPFLHIADWFKDTFSKAWQKVKDVFSAGGKIFNGIKEGITNVFKTVVNGLIGGINNVIAVPFDTVNNMLNTIRNVTIPIINKQPFVDLWGENPLPVPKIPKLATGTVIPASYGEFMAILGDNKREPEIVSPVSAMKQAFKEAIAEMNFTQASNGETVIVLELDGEVVFKKNVQLNQKYKKRHGGRSAFA